MTSKDESMKDELRLLHSQTLFNIGYIFADFDIMRKSISYLKHSVELYPVLENLREYVSVLSNYTDPQAYYMIKEALQSGYAENEKFNLFLNRRLAYLLIDYEMYDEAEEVLNKLLANPKTSEFARGELDYIKSLKEQ